ncbi:MAG: hypothetical protein ACRDT8_19910, partial [Micromonosporaceae bacterium]
PLLLRAVVLGAGYAALLLAAPMLASSPVFAVVAGGVAVLAAIWVSSPWVAVVEHLAVIGWFGLTLAYDVVISPPQVAGLAAAIYLHHSAATLAAALPLDAVVAPSVLVGWSKRVAVVLGLALPLGWGVLALPELLDSSGQLWLPIAGTAAALAAAYGLVRLALPQRAPNRDGEPADHG